LIFLSPMRRFRGTGFRACRVGFRADFLLQSGIRSRITFGPEARSPVVAWIKYRRAEMRAAGDALRVFFPEPWFLVTDPHE
jgi:hypothetical protein